MTWRSLEELLKVKITSLLHDPPWKAAIFASDSEDPLLERGKKIKDEHGLKALEADAIALAEMVGLNWIVCDRDIRGKAEVANKVAATFDRLLLPRNEKFKSRAMKILNIFNPSLEIQVKKPNIEKIKSFAQELRQIVEPLISKNLLLAYHVLWFAYEPLWYKHCDADTTSPADTRVPTHSIFDHVYAAAMVSNIAMPTKGLEPKFEGYVLVIDFAGVQRYISRSRKLRDMWASSWISSLLAWLAIEPFVACFGPDVVVSPSLRGNWFYISWLVEKMNSVGMAKQVESIARDSYAYPGWPKHPLMPTRVILVLPKIVEHSSCRVGGEVCEQLCRALAEGEESLEEFIRRNVSEKWRKALEKIIDDLRKLIEISIEINDIEIDASEIAKLAEEIALRPPLPLRIIVLELGKVVEEYREWLRNLKLELEQWWALFYHFVMAIKIPTLEAMYKLSRLEPDANDAWRSLGPAIKKMKFCTVCGTRPAVIAVPRDKYEEFIRKVKERSMQIARGLISDGERLCPECAVKRLISFYYDKVLEAVALGNVPEDERIYLPSTYDVANLDRILGSWSDRVLDVVKEIARRNALQYLVGKFNIRRLDVGELSKDLEEKVRERCHRIALQFNTDKELCVAVVKELLGTLIEASISDDVLEEFERGLKDLTPILDNVVEEMRKIIEYMRSERSTRYAIVKGDGDNIGSRLHKGKLTYSAREYLNTIVEAIRSFIKAPNDDSKVNDVVEKWIETYVNVCDRLGVTMPLTPSYHYSISRALSIIAIRDAKIIERYRGFVVYVGGDDLLAICPTFVKLDKGEEYVPLRVVIDTRKNYWGEYIRTEPRGFLTYVNPVKVCGPVLAPAMHCYGRSYSIVIAHYRDPMKMAIDRATELEEIAKEEIATVTISKGSTLQTTDVEVLCRRSDALCRDKLIVEEMRSSLIASLPLRLKTINAEIAELVEKSIEFAYMVERDVSKSLFYDIRSQFGLELVTLAKKGYVDELIKVLHRVVNRNEVRHGVASKIVGYLYNVRNLVDVYERRDLIKKVLGIEHVYEPVIPLPIEILSIIMIIVRSRR